jgi:hypothetical protein
VGGWEHTCEEGVIGGMKGIHLCGNGSSRDSQDKGASVVNLTTKTEKRNRWMHKTIRREGGREEGQVAVTLG